MMAHLTLNFGKCVRQRKLKLPPPLEARLRSVLNQGGDSLPPPFDDYRVESVTMATGVVFWFYKREAIISFCAGTWSDAAATEYWTQVEDEYLTLKDLCPQLCVAKRPPKMPGSVPWLATVLLPRFITDVKSDSPDVELLNTWEYVLFSVARDLACS